MSKEKEKEVVKAPEKVILVKASEINAQAISQGYYKGRIINPGENFKFLGVLVGGKLPLWIKDLDAKKDKNEESLDELV